MFDLYATKQTFKEYETFYKSPYWNTFIMRYESNIITAPHYADSIEISIYTNASGNVHIGNNHYNLSGKQAYIVMPNVIHSMSYEKSNGYSVVLKINCEALKPIFNVEAFLQENNLTFYNVQPLISDFDEIHKLAEVFLSSDSFNDKLIAFISILQLVVSEVQKNHKSVLNTKISDDLKTVIDWTENNFTQKITLDDAAHLSAYSKHYFCKKFKSVTGMTYLSYLNHLRIYYACELLQKNETLGSVCEKCGFDDMSYFIQLFKRIMEITPKKYIQQLSSNHEE